MHESASGHVVSNAFNRYSAGQHAAPQGYGGSPAHPNPSNVLGPGGSSMQVNPYDQVAHTNYAYPTAVERTALLIRDVITGFIFEDIEWYTTVGLPWLHTNEVTFEWNKWNFNGGLADRVPYEGLSRLITTRRESHRAHIERRGLAFIMEADFADTQVGREMWDNNVMSIAQAVQETQDHDTIHALLTCKDYAQMWMHRFGTAEVSHHDILTDEILTFGSMNLHNGEGRLGLLVEQHKGLMRREGEAPNMMIMWPGAANYMTMVHDTERMEYWKAGPDGIALREQGPAARTIFRGLRVFETRDFYVGGAKSAAVQLMTRPVQIAEFQLMYVSRLDEACFDYESKEMGTVLYDENADEWRKITLMQAFEHTKIFDSHGNLARPVDDMITQYNMDGRQPLGADGNKGVVEPTFFLAAPDAVGRWGPVERFGMMEIQHMSSMHVQRIAESLVGQMQGSAAMHQWQEFKHLMRDIQSQGYNQGFWAALIAQNSRSSLASDGTFIGQRTPMDLSKYWDVPVQVQWTPNQYGGLDLPEGGSATGVTIPAGFDNIPGLRTLAAKADDVNSQWRAAGARARNALTMLENVLDVVKRSLPGTAAVDPTGRPRWFHQEDALTTLFSSVVGTMADPLFLAHLPLVAGAVGGGAAEAAAAVAAGTAGADGSLPWFVLPGTLFDVQSGTSLAIPGEVEAIAAVLAASGDDTTPAAFTGAAPAMTRVVTNAGAPGVGGVIMKLPSGPPLTVSAATFTNVLQMTPELRALGMMPSGTSDAARSTRIGFYDTMRKLTKDTDRSSLSDFAYGFGVGRSRTTMWDAMRGLRLVSDDDLVGVVQALHLGPQADDAAKVAARAQVDVLTALAGVVDYGDATPLTTEWRSLFKTQAAPTGSFGFNSVAVDAQRALDLERSILESASRLPAARYLAAQTAYRGGDALTDAARTAFDALTAGAGVDAAAFAAQQTELSAALVRVTATLTSQAGVGGAGAAADAAAAAARTMAGGTTGGAPVVVADSVAAIAGAAYYRAPLTSSRALLDSLSSMFASPAGVVAKPLVLPSDPSTAHTQPYGWHGDDDQAAVLPGSMVSRAPFTSVGDALYHAQTRPEYATFQEMDMSSDKHALMATPMMQRFRVALESAVPVTALGGGTSSVISDSMTSFGGGGGGAFDDSDDEDISGLSTAAAFRMAAPMSKRSRGAALIGAPPPGRGGAHTHAHTHPHMGNGQTEAIQAAYGRIKTGTFEHRWSEAGKIQHPLVRMVARAFLQARADKADTWRAMIQGNAIIPMNILLTRPNIVHDMSSVIIMKGGPTTGANFYGNANVARGSDSQTKRIHYNFTFHSKAQVYKHENVAIIENVAFAGYLGGHNTTWMERKEDWDRRDRERPSLIAMAISIAEHNLGAHLDLTGRHQVPESDPSREGPRRWMYSSAVYYDGLWNFSDRATTSNVMSAQDYFDRRDRTTSLASQGVQYLYNYREGRFSRFIKPQGHLKVNMAVPGGAAVMSNAAERFDDYNYAMVHIE